MIKVTKCPKCQAEIELNIAKCIDFNGEVYRCKKCGFEFRYTEK